MNNVSTEDRDFVNERDRASTVLHGAFVTALISGVTDEQLAKIEKDARAEANDLFSDLIAISRDRLAAAASRAPLHMVKPGAQERPARFDDHGQRAA